MFRPDATGKPVQALPTKIIINRLTVDHMTDGLWKEYRSGKEITPHQVAKLLKPFGVRATKIRFAAWHKIEVNPKTTWCGGLSGDG